MRYMQHQDRPGGWTEWYTPRRKGYKIRCCDCHLVHVFEFRIKGGKIQIRAKRDERRTAASRRKLTVRSKKIIAEVAQQLAPALDRLARR